MVLFPFFRTDILSRHRFHHFSSSNEFPWQSDQARYLYISMGIRNRLITHTNRLFMRVYCVHVRDPWYFTNVLHIKVSFIGFVARQKSRKNFQRISPYEIYSSQRIGCDWMAYIRRKDDGRKSICTNNDNSNEIDSLSKMKIVLIILILTLLTFLNELFL